MLTSRIQPATRGKRGQMAARALAGTANTCEQAEQVI
jgi:hypothetical protein